MHGPTPPDRALGLERVIDETGRATADVGPAPELLARMYREMRRVRLIDERMLARQRQGKIGFYGTVTGQEAVPVATALALEPRDWVFPALREAAVMLVRGFPLTRWLAQVYGSTSDTQKGRQMPSHQSGRDVNQVAWSSCIGPQLPQAVGAAWAARLRGEPTVVVGFMGDGATSQPDFHCAMNFAAVFRAPCVLICQNNHWSISVPTSRQTASETLAVKAHAYGMRGIRVDGNDVVALHAVVREAVERARQTCEPTFIEAVTYRMGPHSSSDDPTRYQAPEEVAAWRARDPLTRLRAYLEANHGFTSAAAAALDAELDHEILEAIRVVESEPFSETNTLFEDVFETLPWHLREQRDELMKQPRRGGRDHP